MIQNALKQADLDSTLLEQALADERTIAEVLADHMVDEGDRPTLVNT